MHTLNEKQREAVRAVNGKILVLAGAGSGKTKVLTYRIAHLIEQHGVNPLNILALTFTNKAAKEMKERLKGLIKSKSQDVFLSTFHSFCVNILRHNASCLGYSNNFSIYDPGDVKRIAVNVLKNEIGSTISPTLFLEAVSKVKNKSLDIEGLENIENTDEKMFKDLYTKYNSILKTYNAVDFDSLLTLTIELFEKNPKILEKYQNQYKYVLIDEYQDTNMVQFKLADMLTKKHKNLFVVGDDDQSIYGWRGSSVNHILEFDADQTIKLEKNYRSTNIILHAANSVIKNNKARHNKTLYSDIITDEKITLFHTKTEIEEAEAVVERILKIKEERNIRWKDIAILYRSNVLSRNFETHLLNVSYKNENKWVRGIPYQVFGGLSFSERAEIKDVISYLKVISNPKDMEALLRIINHPRRGISDKTIDEIKKFSEKTKIDFFKILEKIKNNEIGTEINITDKAKAAITNFTTIILEAKERFNKGSLYKSLEWLLERIDYKSAIEEEVKSEKARIFKWENALECINALAAYEEEEENPNLADFISTTMLSKENLNKKREFSDDKLQLMTIHSSKGLEFEACFIVGLEDNILPHEKSLMETSLEEERRLFYVAITRAKRYLTLSMARTRLYKGKPKATNPSRFLFEIPKDFLNICSKK